MLKNLADVNIAETNELIESVLGELISKDILYEPFQSMKNKVRCLFLLPSLYESQFIRLKKKSRVETERMKRDWN